MAARAEMIQYLLLLEDALEKIQKGMTTVDEVIAKVPMSHSKFSTIVIEGEDNISLFLFKDGIRRLTFKKGIPAALHALTLVHPDIAKEIVLGEIKKSSFIEKPFDERKIFFEALATWQHNNVIEFLLITLRKKSLFRKAKIVENQALAAYALGLMGEKRAFRFVTLKH